MKENRVKQLLRLDAFGALLSAFFLGVCLVHFQPLVGIPTSALYLLAIFPVIFACYDVYYLLLKQTQLAKGLKGIAIANIAYCVFSIVVSFKHFNDITILGWGYMIIEVIIVLILAIIEFRTALKTGR
jgi:hypothetical protein